jgi:hypothetical protein
MFLVQKAQRRKAVIRFLSEDRNRNYIYNMHSPAGAKCNKGRNGCYMEEQWQAYRDRKNAYAPIAFTRVSLPSYGKQTCCICGNKGHIRTGNGSCHIFSLPPNTLSCLANVRRYTQLSTAMDMDRSRLHLRNKARQDNQVHGGLL